MSTVRTEERPLGAAVGDVIGERVTDLVELSRSPPTTVLRVLPVGGRTLIVKLHERAYRAERERDVHAIVAASRRVQAAPLLSVSLEPPMLVYADTGLSPLPSCGVAATEALGEILAAFHQVTVDASALPTGRARLRPVEEQVAYLLKSVSFTIGERVRGALERLAEQSQRHRAVLCHGDLHPGNVLHKVGSSGLPVLIDFEQATLAPPEFDLARTLVLLDGFSLKIRSRLLAAYGSPVSADLLAGMVLFHSTSGWVHAQREQRDLARWQRRFRAAAAAIPERSHQ